ncbi:MAG: thiamine phosphate synthase [Bacillota bacterium]|nr:thiamine phosphate synthase [Bacillota bacterium]
MLYLISNRKLVKDRNFIEVMQQAAEGGVDAIILREKDLPYEELLPIAEEVKRVIANTKTLLIINSSLQVAKDVQAHGYHSSFNAFMGNKPNFNGELGVSVHTLEEAVAAEEKGADYLLVSHIFETDCKKGLAPKGIGVIEEVRKAVKIPIIALGGINLNNAEQVLLAGANGFAVMSSIMKDESPDILAGEFKKIIKNTVK